MAKTARPIDYQKIRRIKVQIDDEQYITRAVQVIAHRLTSYLIDSLYVRNGSSSSNWIR